MFGGTERRFEPDEAYEYASNGYNLLAAVIEEVAGMPYLDCMREKIFVPLEMRNTRPENIGRLDSLDTQRYYIDDGNAGKISLNTDKQFLEEIPIFYLNRGKDYAALTSFGVLYLELRPADSLSGNLFWYENRNESNPLTHTDLGF